MGLLEKIKGLFKKDSDTAPVLPVLPKKEEKGLHIEEVDLGSVSEPPRRSVAPKKTEEVMKEVDEKKKFMEVVNLLRKEVGLPPVEEAFKKERVTIMPRPKAEVQVLPQKEQRVERPVAEKREEAVEHPPERKRPPSRAEVEKVVKVAFKKVEGELMKMVDEELRKRGVRSFKELAMNRRKAREYLRSNAETVIETITGDFLSGKDVRSDEYVRSLASSLFRDVFGSVVEEKKAGPPKEEVKEEAKPEEEDLLSLLGGGKEERGVKKEEEPEGEEDDLLKLLSS